VAGYVDFVRAGVGQLGLWESLRGQIFLGSDAFIDSMRQIAADQTTLAEIPRAQRRPLARPLTEYRDTIINARAAMAAAYATGYYTMQEIATCFGVHYAQ